MSTNQKIYPLGFGGASLSGEGGGYGFGSMSETEAERLLKCSWEQGLNLYDTAPIYGFGLSEERMGRYLPKDAFIVTKGGVDWHANRRVNMSNDPVVIERMLFESLKRLKRDVIDVYMIHWPDAKVDIRRPLEVLIKAQTKGHIKHIGLCNTNSDDLKLAEEMGPIPYLQSEVNLFNHTSFANLGMDWRKKITMSWGTFDKGILSGRVTTDRRFSSDDCRSWAPWWDKKDVAKKILKVNKLKLILAEEGISLPKFCLSFNLQFVGITNCLIGFKTENDLQEMSQTLQELVSREKIEGVLKQWE